MEAEKTNGAAPSSPQATGFRPRKLEEHHHSSTLVGRIVEKGFSSGQPSAPASSLPHPTVLPFPVARHRSHGPRWGPVATAMDVGQDDAEEEMDPLDYGAAAHLARSIQKREKKGLDFSRWKEVARGEGSASPSKVRKKHESAAMPRPVEQEKAGFFAGPSISEDCFVRGETGELSSPVTETPVPGEVSRELLVNSSVELNRSEKSKKYDAKCLPAHVPTTTDVEPKPFASAALRGGNSSVMEDINAENLARLRQMSPQEIAEAHAEIMEKMDPAMLEMLKKRGQRKRRNRRATPAEEKERGSPYGVEPVEGAKGSRQVDVRKVEGFRSPWNVEAKQVEVTSSSQKVESRPAYSEWLSSGASHSSSWKAWCERVEKVRDLRFTLDGNVVEDDSSQVLSNDGSTHFSQYNPANVTERDFLRTEGDPGAAGYTIKEAITLIRSIVPAQRSFALQLLASVLNKCLHHLQQKDCGSNVINANHAHRVVDWQAIWAYAFGPEPEFALALRIALDDNHNSVVLTCAKVIQCMLCCDVNENYFGISEQLCIYGKDVYTAPVFRSRPEINSGYLRGGFWKYSAKPSNIHPFTDENEDAENAEKHTIQDDVVVAGQDVAAGLVRMGILPRICYLLEMDPLPTLDECLVSVLIALARHSPSCVAAIMKCPRLIETVVRRFNEQHVVEAYPSKIKSVVLLRVLSQADKKNCLEFVNHGFFREMMWHMYKDPISLDHWVKSGKELCKLTSGLMVEQLRFWKVCVHYGYCISYFEDFFPAMCMWLSLPTFDKLIEENILGEFASVTQEAYHVLEVLSHRLPRLHSAVQLEKEISEFSDGMESWSWSHVVPMVELATKWLSLKTIPLISFSFTQKNGSSSIHIQWVISAVMHMLSCIFERIVPKDIMCPDEGTATLPWLPFFVPKVGLEIVKNAFFNFCRLSDTAEEGMPTEAVSFVDILCQLRSASDLQTSFSSVSCLHGLVCLADVIDKCIQSAKGMNSNQPLSRSDMEGKILEDGIVKCAHTDLVRVLTEFGALVASEWQDVQSIEMFGRGGPAPGIGVGWGSSGGGFWSTNYLLAEVDAHLVMSLLRIFPIVPEGDLTVVGAMKPATDRSLADMTFTLQRVNTVLGICLVSGPRDRFTLEKAFDILLQVPVLAFLGFCINHFIKVNKGLKSFEWQYLYEDYSFISNTLSAHFRNMWLSYKSKSSREGDDSTANFKSPRKHDRLETIHEDMETSEVLVQRSNDSSLQAEWAHQKLPIPVHWFLSPLSCMNTNGDTGNPCSASHMKATCISSNDCLDVAKSGLFILFGLEALSYFVNFERRHSPIVFVPLVWKLHALSMALLVRTDRMDVLEDEKSKDIFETLQTLYGWHIDQVRHGAEKVPQEENENTTMSSEGSLLLKTVSGCDLAFLSFQSEVHESYTTFIETLVEQFGAISYGNVLYGRQVALYLHRSVEAVVRLAAWNSLTNDHVLELLPPLDKCLAETEGYLEPVEDNEGILEAYSKSWVSGALDKAAIRGSMSFVLALHHLSCFIFHTNPSETVAFRNKLVKFLLRGYSRKPQHQKMLCSLIQYRRPKLQDGCANEGAHLQEAEFKRRFDILSTACEGNSSLLAELANLKLT